MPTVKFSKMKLFICIILFVSITLAILFGLYTRRLDNEINFRSCVKSIENAITTALETDIVLKNELKIDNNGRFLSIEEIKRVFQKIPLDTNYDCNQITPINDKRIRDVEFLVVFVKTESTDIIVGVNFKQ